MVRRWNAPTMASKKDLDQDIQSRIQSFLAELSQLVKMAALGSVHAALGGELEPSMRRGPGRPRGSGKRGPGRPRKAMRRARRALQAAQKYSLVANSVKSEIVVEPELIIEE